MLWLTVGPKPDHDPKPFRCIILWAFLRFTTFLNSLSGKIRANFSSDISLHHDGATNNVIGYNGSEPNPFDFMNFVLSIIHFSAMNIANGSFDKLALRELKKYPFYVRVRKKGIYYLTLPRNRRFGVLENRDSCCPHKDNWFMPT